ncbi:nucleotidyltransferase domain-containing protein [Candidatus Woesearchaeota archaeon]|nr:nucleotidyltransferase domain-containing protein [Candidatus Woesearchaeota archaeon]
MGKRIVARLKEFKARLSKDYSVDKLIFFGSRATGKPHRWSGVDLVIVSSKFRKMDFIQRGARMYDYWELDYPVDFLCYKPEEFKKLSRKITIVSEAVREGVEI